MVCCGANFPRNRSSLLWMITLSSAVSSKTCCTDELSCYLMLGNFDTQFESFHKYGLTSFLTSLFVASYACKIRSSPLGKWQKVGYGLTKIYSLFHLTSSHFVPTLFINDLPTRNSLIVEREWKRDKEHRRL